MLTLLENIFIISIFIVLLFLIFFVKDIKWKNMGLVPGSLWNGWKSVLLFNIFVFIFIQLLIQFVGIPSWMTDKDPIMALFLIVFSQEIIFRGLFISWLEKWGKQRALWISTIIFGLIHLVFPGPWTITFLSFVGGYFWGWHFLKFRNIYLLTISHLIVNLSFNYVLFNFLK